MPFWRWIVHRVRGIMGVVCLVGAWEARLALAYFCWRSLLGLLCRSRTDLEPAFVVKLATAPEKARR